MKKHSPTKESLINLLNKIAPHREKWIKRNQYYYKDLTKFLRYNIPEGRNVLEIGCGIGNVLNDLKPKRGVGIDISPEMIKIAKNKFPHLDFKEMDVEVLNINETFDFVLISDTVGSFEDIQKVFQNLKNVCDYNTRIIITFHNYFWQPILKLGELLHLKMPQQRLNWLNFQDIANLLFLEEFDIIKKGHRFLLPIYIPVISTLFNKYVVNLPFFNRFGIGGYVITRMLSIPKKERKLETVSIVIPARNEKGNIENAVKRIPSMGKHVEIIFVEGHSSDDTLGEIKRVSEKYSDKYDIKYAVQDHKGKGDAVRKGFDMATGDVLMILDADLTVSPDDLPKFYNAIASGKGEYINGSRLVYPMEDEAMKTLNIMGNKFFSMAFSYLLGQPLKDTLCGTKVISKENYKKLINNRSYFGDFDPFGDFDLIFGSAKLNLKIVEIPIRYKAREYGSTNISRFKHGWLLLKMVIFAMNKIRFI